MEIKITDFQIKLNKTNILHAAGCPKGSSIYDTAARYFDELYGDVMSRIKPYAAAVIEGMRAYCLLTAGREISGFIKELFDSGEAVKGLLADNMADELLFEMDKILSGKIKLVCAEKNFGVKKRLSAPEDFPFSEQRVILEKAGTDAVELTDAFMLKPVKSMAYILELTEDRDIFNAQHDCSKCKSPDCPRRTKPYNGGFEIVSGYDYTPSLKKGESAVCVDIGTTTVAFELVTDSGVKSTYKTINPQRRFGADVLSRIEAANRGRSEELASAIRYTLLKGYDEVTKAYGIAGKIIIAGNTSMVHMLMNYPCDGLGRYPFKSSHLSTINTTFDKIAQGGDVIPAVIFGGISAFAGGDIVSGMYMCDFDLSDGINLFIDLGTNGEMAIGGKNGIIVTSAAAGPAFEGGQLSCGTGCVDGAVCGASLNPVRLETIGSKPPSGICGTGIIELLSEMKDNNIIDETGLLSDKYFEHGFKIDDKIFITQNDIRQIQTAKAAVRAGIECLADARGAEYKDIRAVYLAGGFGYGLSVKKACNIGILPAELTEKTRVIGNSSLGGCVKYASRSDGNERIQHIQKLAKDFPLGSNKNFAELYMKYMNF